VAGPGRLDMRVQPYDRSGRIMPRGIDQFVEWRLPLPSFAFLL
jgi:hypothetical protein